MYDARVDIKKILYLLIKKEIIFEEKDGIIQTIAKNIHTHRLSPVDRNKLGEGLQLISNVLRVINHY